MVCDQSFSATVSLFHSCLSHLKAGETDSKSLLLHEGQFDIQVARSRCLSLSSSAALRSAALPSSKEARQHVFVMAMHQLSPCRASNRSISFHLNAQLKDKDKGLLSWIRERSHAHAHIFHPLGWKQQLRCWKYSTSTTVNSCEFHNLVYFCF